MKSRLSVLALAALLLVTAPGCVMARQIHAVDAHPTYNDFEVQTISLRAALFFFWQTDEVWTCHRAGDTFVCEEIDYESSKQGHRWDGPAAPPPAQTSVTPPSPTPTPAPAPPPVLPPQPAPTSTPAPPGGGA